MSPKKERISHKDCKSCFSLSESYPPLPQDVPREVINVVFFFLGGGGGGRELFPDLCCCLAASKLLPILPGRVTCHHEGSSLVLSHIFALGGMDIVAL